jgi:drug/metabolite transporter (DMT)-like permease
MSVTWLFFALSGPVLWAASTHLDKYLVEQYFKQTHPAVLLIFTALANLLALPLIWAYLPGVLYLDRGSSLLMMLSGILLMGAMLLYLRALQFEEASVVAPFFQAAPLFGYALAYAVLGEVLSPIQLLGAALIMLGTVAASLELKRQGRPKLNVRLSLLMLACALAVALSTLIFKVFALRDEFWSTTFWMFAGQAAFGCAFLALPSFRSEFLKILRSSTGAVIGVNVANELINLGGGLGTRYALVLAPMSLVQAVGSTTSVFVFLFGVALSMLWPAFGREDLSRQQLTRKGAAALLVALGVALISR